MICKKCNSEVYENMEFCPYCGEKLDETAQQLDMQSNMQTNQQPNIRPFKEINSTPYLVWAIVVTLLLCLPLGIPAIVYATKIDRLQDYGKYQEAYDAARKSKNFSIAAGCVGIAVLIFVIIASAISMNSYDYYNYYNSF